MARQTQPSDVAAQVSERVEREPSERKSRIDPDNLFPTGSTLLNLACSDHVEGGPELGRIVTVPGSSSSGKTLLLLTGYAEAIHRPRFDEYDFFLDDGEAALAFNLAKLFGEKTEERIEYPHYYNDGRPRCSKTIQDFKANILNKTKEGSKPIIYALDSLDSLSSEEELEKSFKDAIAREKDPDARAKLSGSYHTEKAKILGEVLRMVNDVIEHSRSVLFIVQQIRQNISAGPFGKKYITSGGEAPFFYSHHQIWLNKIETLKSNNRKIGSKTKADVVKNKLTGKLRDVEFPIFSDYGIDDIGSMVDFMVREGYWKKQGKNVMAHDLGIEGTRPTTTPGNAGTLVEQIEDQRLERRLRRAVGKAWNDIEESLKLNRRSRFG